MSEKKTKAKKIGRPSTYTQDLADRLCAELAMGRSLRSVCEADDMPSAVTVFAWMRTNEEFLKQYARAKEESADAMSDEILDIADDGTNDWVLRRGGYVVDREATERSKLRVDTRKWIMSKMKPKKYGDKLDVTSDGKRVQAAPVIISQIQPRTDDDAPNGEADAK